MTARSDLLRRDSKREMRRTVGIAAYVGPNGGGKSLAMVYDTLPSLDRVWRCANLAHRHPHAEACPAVAAGQPHLCSAAEPLCPQDGPTSGRRTVLSTVRIIDPTTGRAHERYRPLRRHRQILRAEHCDLLLDEVTGIANSRATHTMPVAIANVLTQLRRRDVIIRWSSPGWARADSIIREVTGSVTMCRGHLSKREEGRSWGDRRLFRWRTFDAFDFDEFTLGKVESCRPLVTAWYWRPRRDAMTFYDTLDAVDQLTEVTEGGSCLDCGGARRRPKCECPSSDAADATASDVVARIAAGSTPPDILTLDLAGNFTSRS